MHEKKIIKFAVIPILLVVIICGLYLPFISNQLIFDDQGLFANSAIYDFAQLPFSLRPRTFPYFTIGFIQVLSGNIEANRLFSLALHIACSYTLFLFLTFLLPRIWKTAISNSHNRSEFDIRIQIVSAIAVLWFAVHPIAVYGAAYLTQRTILFATFFSLLSLCFYLRAFAENRTRDIVTAAVFYSLAVFSKEHAIMVPFAAVALTALFEGSWHAHWRRIALYAVLCAPAALTVFFTMKYIVAVGYEPDVGGLASNMYPIPIMAYPWGKWIVSMVMQAGLFFAYPALWIAPNVHILSADMRFDFVHIWFAWWSFPAALLFFISPFVAAYFLHRKGSIALFCCGFLYAWILFLTEIVAVRFQEPFVLYRSYLWAPGYLLMLVAVCAHVRLRWLVLGAVPMLVVCFFLARERLSSLEDDAHLWKDAAAKLSSPTILGSDRIFYNRGQAYFREKKYPEAVADFSRTIAERPLIYQPYYNRALAYYAQQKYPEALADLDLALSMNQKDSSIQYMRGLVFERSGCEDAALRAYTASSNLGNQIAKLMVDDLEKRKKKRERLQVCSDRS